LFKDFFKKSKAIFRLFIIIKINFFLKREAHLLASLVLEKINSKNLLILAFYFEFINDFFCEIIF
jgi:hypothetical protein